MSNIPKLVFIVPYRDRENDKNIYSNRMRLILQSKPELEYRILFIHQTDNREFNRGAMKNIGFLVVKNMYPFDYYDITLCFNDIDTYPMKDTISFDYVTKRGIVKHFYGYHFALHGIVSITCFDFERINGYPNYWAWGYEDNMLHKRVIEANMIVDRSIFYPIDNQNTINHNNATYLRIVNEVEFQRYMNKVNEGINSIQNLQYVIDDMMVNVLQFNTEYICRSDLNILFPITWKYIEPYLSI